MKTHTITETRDMDTTEVDYFKVKNTLLDFFRRDEQANESRVQKLQYLLKELIGTGSKDQKDKNEKEKQIQTIVEHTIRRKLDEDLRNFVDSIDYNPQHESINNLLKFCISLAQKGVVRYQTLFILIQDTFETLSTKECVDWFGFIENNTDDLRQLLKSANDISVNGLAVRALTGLMRRLSKTNDIVFCGRILMTLSRMMPLLDPSGVNPKGLINKANITSFQSQEQEKVSSDNGNTVEIEKTTLHQEKGDNKEPTSESSNIDVPIDYQFHRQFWSMMQFLQDPEKALSSETCWDTVCNYIRQVLRAFTTITTLQNEEGADIVSSDAYFTKFLTSPKLIQLEAQDPYFRRHVLIQLLIFYQALKKSSSKINEWTLPDSKKNTLDEFEKKTRNLLEKTAANGKKLATIVSHILKREENWANWKRDGCVTFERFPKPSKSKGKRTHSSLHSSMAVDTPPIDDDLKSKKQKISLGNEVLDQLWNQSLTVEDFEGPPSIQQVLMPAIEELQGDIDPELPKLVEKNIFQWKAYRMVMRHSFDLLLQLNKKKLEEVLLENPFNTEQAKTDTSETMDIADSTLSSPTRSPPVVIKREETRSEKSLSTKKLKTESQDVKKDIKNELEVKRRVARANK